MSDSNRLLAVLNVAMADTAFTIWSSKRFYGAAMPVEVTWRPATSIPLVSTVDISDAVGEAVAMYVNGHSMKRRRPNDD
jgi:hypothetical protein